MRGSRVAKMVGVAAALALMATACVDVTAPETRSGRSASDDRPLEILVFHGLAETLSTVTLDAVDGGIAEITDNVRELGAVPNDITFGDTAGEILITVSGENRVLVLDESTLRVIDEIVLPTGSNPMSSVALGTLSDAGAGIVATSALFSGALLLNDRSERDWSVSVDGELRGTLPVEMPVGVAPQAVLGLAGQNGNTVRLIVTNTAYDGSRASATPFGVGTLDEYEVDIHATDGTVAIRAIERGYTFGEVDSEGLNPTALRLIPAAGSQPEEILVVGSGANLSGGNGGDGADDGRLLILNRDTRAVREEIAVGGSPGSLALLRESQGYRVFLAGPRGIRTVFRDDDTGWSSGGTGSSLVYDAIGGSLNLIADVAVYSGTDGVSLYATDYWESRILRFRVGDGGALELEQSLEMPQGPQGMLLVEETL